MITVRSLLVQAAIWLVVPVVLFIMFWTTPYVSVPLLGLLAFSMWRVFSVRLSEHSNGYSAISMRKGWVVMAAVVVLYVVVSGIGGFVAQMPNDHAWRNAVFFDLARRLWPVQYPGPDSGDGVVALCYYFAFWLPSALVAKVTGLIIIGDFFQVLWAAWGTWLALCFIFSMTGGRMRWRILLIFIFFNTCDLVTSAIFSEEYYNIFENPLAPQLMWLSTTSSNFGNSANAVFYNFIYNQTIPTWVGLSVLLYLRNRPGQLLLWFGLLVIYAPIPCVALSPCIALRLLQSPGQTITVRNLTGFLIALVAAIFLLSNNSAGSFRILTADGSLLKLAGMNILFALLSYGVYIPLIWPYVRRSALFWSLLAMALVVPLFGIGTTPDLAWRISVPLVMLICINMCRLSVGLRELSRPLRGWFWTLLIVGSFSPCYLMVRTLINEKEVHQGLRERKYLFMMNHLDDPAANPYYNNFISTTLPANPLFRYSFPGGEKSAEKGDSGENK